MCNINDKKEKEKKIRDTAESLYRRRYEGIVEIKDFFHPIMMKEDDNEFGKFSATFSSGTNYPREVFFSDALFDELEETALENNVEVSTLINCYLLQMLERNKRTVEHTKARKMYVKNTLYSGSHYISEAEKLEEFEENIFDPEFINYKEISFKELSVDEEIYIENFLLNKGYTLEQIHQIGKEEKEIQGTFTSGEGEIMRPKSISMERYFEKFPGLNYDYDVHLFIPARLGLHYILLNKVETFRSYEDVEAFLISKLKGDKTIWDLYASYLEKSLI